jgi:hypothetical protein
VREWAAGRGRGVRSIERHILRSNGRPMRLRRRRDDDRRRCRGQEKYEEEPGGSGDDTPGALHLRSDACAPARTGANELTIWPPRHSVPLPPGSRGTCTPSVESETRFAAQKLLKSADCEGNLWIAPALSTRRWSQGRCRTVPRGAALRRPSSGRSNQMSVRESPARDAPASIR